MCLKLSTKREIGEAGPGAARLAVEGQLPRVRVQALRTLGAVGTLDQLHAEVDGRPHAEVVGQLGDQLADRRLQVARRG
jgi:hypothetical protein